MGDLEITRETILVAILSSPVIIAIINKLFSMKPNKNIKEELVNIKTEIEGVKNEVEEIPILKNDVNNINVSLSEYKIQQAILDLKQKNWKLIESGKTRMYSNEEFYTVYNNLIDLLPFSQWDEELKEETKKAIKILREGRKND